MNEEFLRGMRTLATFASAQENQCTYLEASYLNRLVDMAEQAESLERTNSLLYEETKKVERDVAARIEALTLHANHIETQHAIALKIMTPDQRDKLKEIMDDWSIDDVLTFLKQEDEVK